MNSSNSISKKKVLFILGATGTGKTKLSIELAKHFSGEIINSDKIQVYKGLDIITNKVTKSEQDGVRHHLLGFIDPEEDFTVNDFCHDTIKAINEIIKNGNLPIIVGGSNTYIEALMEDPSIRFRDNFDCCFLWMDVSLPVLYRRVAKRVDQIVDAGLVNEVRGMYVPKADYSRGIRRAIGAQEMDNYFKVEQNMKDEDNKMMLLKVSIEEIKENTCKLVNRQLGKIQRLMYEVGWDIHRIDATCAFEECDKDVEDAWENVVLKSSLQIVSGFQKESNGKSALARKKHSILSQFINFLRKFMFLTGEMDEVK